MQYPMFERFRSTIASITPVELRGEGTWLDRLEIAKSSNLRVCYTPFEYVNRQARIVVVGMTPGRKQLTDAIAECQRQLSAGEDADAVLRAAKKVGAFSGPMRPNLVALLDCIGVNQHLRIQSCASLFAGDARLLQSTSVLRNAVFVAGSNYSGAPSIGKTPFLRERLSEEFGEDARLLPDAVFVPLGDAAADGMNCLVASGHIRRSQVLEGLPHPSGANAERIAYFLGRKARSDLSPKTNASKLDAARGTLLSKVGAL
jgi:hypothetical protein